jgi:hypothetical protein
MDAIRIGIALAFIGLMTILLRRLFAKKEWGIPTCFSMAVAVYIACSFLRLWLRR